MAVNAVVEHLAALAKPVTTSQEIEQVSRLSRPLRLDQGLSGREQ